MNDADVQQETSPDALWVGIPTSNVYKQRRLTGWRDETDEGGEPIARESRAWTPDAESQAAVRALLRGDGRTRDAVLLAIYHVVLQWYLDDLESVICVLLPNGSATRRMMVSYAYVEDDEKVSDLLDAVQQQLRTGRIAPFDDIESLADVRGAPMFFYSLESPSPRPSTPARAPQHGRVLMTVADADPVSTALSMPSTIARNVPIDELQRRFDRALAALAAGDGLRIGELKARLGEAAPVPYRQVEEMQRRVITVWAKVLNIPADSLSESSSFYSVGGTSLNAFKLVNRLRVEFERDVSIWDILEHPTVHELARLLLRG